MRLTFLGTGTSFGVPIVGCDCGTCTSDDPRDRRTRHGALLTAGDGRRILVDTPPDLWAQLLREGVDGIDAVWFTHGHADHIHGIDDLRIFTLRGRRPLPAFASPACSESLTRRFAYIFDTGVDAPPGTTAPKLALTRFRHREPVEVLGIDFLPLAVPHGVLRVYGFRTGDLGYVTDAKRLPDDVVGELRGVRVLVLNALWRGKSHPTHLNVEEAVETARAVGADRTFLTHLTHRVRHADLAASLPERIEPAYDGLTVEV